MSSVFPVPDHLSDILIPNTSKSDETNITGTLRCTCGNEKFELLHTGGTGERKDELIVKVARIDGEFFLRICAKCTSCKAELLIFDDDFHGWNGWGSYLGSENPNSKRPRPKVISWFCQRCSANSHRVFVDIQGAKENIIDDSDDFLNDSNWYNAFEWITIDIECTACGFRPSVWVSHETM